MRTAMLIPPTLSEVEAAARDIGLPTREAQKFFHYFESNGWKVGKTRMVNFRSALAGWKLRYEERGGAPPEFGNGASKEPSAMDKMICQKEFERVEARLQSIKSSYGEAQTWTRQDKLIYGKLLERRKELRMKLGVML